MKAFPLKSPDIRGSDEEMWGLNGILVCFLDPLAHSPSQLNSVFTGH